MRSLGSADGGAAGKPRLMFDAVLVDYDGTLMDTNDLVLRSWLYAIKKLTGRDAGYAEVSASFGEVLSDSMKRILPDVPLETAVATYREYQHDRYLESIRPYDGAKETLALLRSKGCRIGLPTSRLRNSTIKGLRHFGLEGLFDAIVTADETVRFKPDPEPLLLTLGRLGIRPENALMVGDTKHDLEAARAAGVRSALVDWSVALPKERRAGAPAPDFVIRHWSEISGIVLL